jgi:1,2-diacylglycerol 3-alpha-glucosyltransferase
VRIGIFTDAYAPYISGVVTSEVMLKKALEKKGHQVYVVTVNLESFKYEYDEKTRVYKIPGIPVGINELRQSGVYPIRAINKIKKWNLDVIHTQTEFAIGTFARVLGKQLDIPVVHTYHTMYEDYIHYVTKGYFDGISKKIVEYITKFYCDTTIEELIVPTKKTYDLFKEKYKYDRNVHVIPTGIEIERFYREKLNKEKILNLKKKLGLLNDNVILYLGRISCEKRIDFLIKNQVNLIKKVNNCKLLIVGDGPELEEYKRLVSKLKIEDNVIFTGKVPWEEVPYYYAISDIFATNSDFETQGLTVIEAMAAGLPVVALDDDAFRNVVIDGLTGYLFKNKKDYQNVIFKLFQDKGSREQMGNQARINSETYSSKYFAERVLSVYKLAMKGSSKNKSFFARLKGTIKKGIYGK